MQTSDVQLWKVSIDFRRLVCIELDRGGDRLGCLLVAHRQAELSQQRGRECVFRQREELSWNLERWK